MLEQLVRWEPLNNLSKKYKIESLVDDVNTIKIVFSDLYKVEKRMSFLFEETVRVYKKTNKNAWISSIETFGQKTEKILFDEWTFFKVVNSKYILLLAEESCGFFQPEWFIHFVFAGENIIVEVVAGGEPIVEFVRELENNVRVD